MGSFKIILVSIFFVSVVSGTEKPFKPCNKDDTKCLSEIIMNFVKEHSDIGFPICDVKPLNPLYISEFKVVINPTIAYEFKNVTITGLQDLEILDYKMYADEKLKNGVDVFTAKGVINIAGDVKIIYTKENKIFTGTYTASAIASLRSQYGSRLTRKGDEEYFEIGPETIKCKIIGRPDVNIVGDPQNSLNNDSGARDMDQNYRIEKVCLEKKTISSILETGFTQYIEFIRVLANAFPKKAFFKDI